MPTDPAADGKYDGQDRDVMELEMMCEYGNHKEVL